MPPYFQPLPVTVEPGSAFPLRTAYSGWWDTLAFAPGTALQMSHHPVASPKRRVSAQVAKPASAKGRYIHQITLTTTMGPGLKVDPSRVRGILEEFDSAPREQEAVPA